MHSLTFEQIASAAESLTPAEQALLITRLQAKASLSKGTRVTRESVLAELERRRAAGAFENVESLHGKFAHPALDLTFDEIQTITHEAATEWESEMDEFDGSH